MFVKMSHKFNQNVCSLPLNDMFAGVLDPAEGLPPVDRGADDIHGG